MNERMRMEVAARQRALRVLEGLEGRPVQEALNAGLAGGDDRERSLCTELVYGVLRGEDRLDFLLNQFLGNPRKTPPKLRWILRMGLYGLLHMDRTPAAVTVDACVHTAREVCGQALSRVANGVLRGFLRSDWAGMDAGERLAALVAQGGLAMATGLPGWIVDLWRDGYGAETAEKLALAAADTPWPCVRVNALREGATALRHRLLEHGEPVGSWGVRLSPRNQPEDLEQLMRDGQLSRQGAGSLLLLEALLPHVRGRVWDGCAGFGGKTLALLERGVHVVLAGDTHRGRLDGLRRETARLGLSSPLVMQASAAQPPLKPGCVDTILLDVPCGGLGTLARRPDLRRQRRPEHLEPLITLQKTMLRAAWSLLPPGGVLLYATCALNPAENEQQIHTFLEENGDAHRLTTHSPQPDGFGSDLLYGAAMQKNTGMA